MDKNVALKSASATAPEPLAFMVIKPLDIIFSFSDLFIEMTYLLLKLQTYED